MFFDNYVILKVLNAKSFSSSYKEFVMDDLAGSGDEGRGKLR